MTFLEEAEQALVHDHLSGLSLNLFQVAEIFLELGSPKIRHSLHAVSYKIPGTSS